MHDLRKQVLLESGKTLSKKAKAKQAMGSAASSKQNSPNASRAGSRVASRQASDDEADYSDSTTQFRYASRLDLTCTTQSLIILAVLTLSTNSDLKTSTRPKMLGSHS